MRELDSEFVVREEKSLGSRKHAAHMHYALALFAGRVS